MKDCVKNLLWGFFSLLCIGVGLLIGWLIFKGSSVAELNLLIVFWVVAMLFLLLLIVVLGIGGILLQINTRFKGYFEKWLNINFEEIDEEKIKSLSYLDFEQFSPLTRMIQLLFTGLLIIVLSIVIGLIVLALQIGT